MDECVEKNVQTSSVLIKDKSCTELRFQIFTAEFFLLHQKRALTIELSVLPLHASTVERVGENKSLPVRSRLSDKPSWGNPAGSQT